MVVGPGSVFSNYHNFYHFLLDIFFTSFYNMEGVVDKKKGG